MTLIVRHGRKSGRPERLLRAFSRAAVRLIRVARPVAFGVVSGETAWRVLRDLGCGFVTITGQAAAFVPLGVPGGGALDGCPFVCKAGSTGDDESVRAMIRGLRDARPAPALSRGSGKPC